MPKGSFTQCACLLLNRTPTLNEIEGALGTSVEVVSRHEETDDWEFFGPSVTVAYRPEVNGFVAIDVVDKPWPDSMGDPEEDGTLFGAWAMGYFGPGAFPQGLERAQEQAWALEDEDLDIVNGHSAFVRIRMSYVFGEQDEDAPVMPEDCDSIDELEFLTKLTTALMELPGVVCSFNPNGEVLLDKVNYDETLKFHEDGESIPFELWTNVRLFQIGEDWCVLDTVGNDQFDLPDIEATFFAELADPDDINEFLRGVTYYMLEEGNEISDGDAIEGPGEHPWNVAFYEDSLCDPPRSVLRLTPDDGREMPEELRLAHEEATSNDELTAEEALADKTPTDKTPTDETSGAETSGAETSGAETSGAEKTSDEG